MRNSNGDEPEAEPVADYLALAVLGEKILQGNPGANEGPGVGLAAILELMKSNGPGAVEKLKKWVEVTPDAESVGGGVTKSGANAIFSPTRESSSGVDLNKAPSSSIDPSESDGDVTGSSASIIEAARGSRPFLIALAIGLLLFMGIVVFGISRAYSKFVSEPAAQAAADEDDLAAKKRAEYSAKEQRDIDAREAKKERQGNAGRENKKANRRKANREKAAAADKGAAENEKPEENTAEEPKVNNLDASLDDAEPSEALADEETPEETEPAEKPSKYLGILGNRDAESVAGSGDEKDSAKETVGEDGVPKAITDPDDLIKLTGIGPATDKVLKAGGVTTYDQIAKMTPAQLDIVLEKGGGQKLGEKWAKIIEEAKPLAEVSLSRAADHFRKVPSEFELPAIDSSNPIKLTPSPLLIPANYSLTTELVCPDGVSPRRIAFELNKSTDGQTWTVVAKKSKTASKSTNIATFTKTFDALNFAWLPEAAKDKSAVYLRNCLLRLSTPDGKSTVSKLRKPVAIRPLRLTEDDVSDSLKIEIEGAPDFDQIKMQLRAFRRRGRVLEIIDPSITFDSPALVSLKFREKSAFMLLQVSAQRVGGGLKLNAGLFFDGKLVKSKEELIAIRNRFAAEVGNAQRRSNLKAAERKKQVNAAEAMLGRMDQYLNSIEWLFAGGGGIGEAIEFDISADFEDGTVALVKSNKNLVNEDKKKKK